MTIPRWKSRPFDKLRASSRLSGGNAPQNTPGTARVARAWRIFEKPFLFGKGLNPHGY